MKRQLIAALLLTVGCAVSASAQSIGVYWDTSGTDCDVTQPSGTGGTLYLLAGLGGASAGGTTGAEFRLENFPSSWFANVTPNPAANLTLGNPLQGGCNIAFPACQVGSGGVVLLYTVSYFAADQQLDRVVSVLRHSSPSNINFQCPLHTLCDAPNFTKICVTGREGRINGSCAVAAEPRSWSAVKAMFH